MGRGRAPGLLGGRVRGQDLGMEKEELSELALPSHS